MWTLLGMLIGPALAGASDKDIYDLSVLGSVTSGHGLGAHLRGRVAPWLVVDGTIQQTLESAIPEETGVYYLTPSFQAGVGASLAPFGSGLRGLTIGARALAGPADYTWSGNLEGCGDSPCYWDDPKSVVDDSVHAMVQPNVALTWIGHPGFTVGVEYALDVPVCCDLHPTETNVRGTFGANIGWSFPVGQKAPSPAEARAAMSPDDAARRRRLNRGLDTGMEVAGGGLVLVGLGAAVLAASLAASMGGGW